jgi:hypothetical protein
LVCERGAGDETLLALAFQDDGFGEESAGGGVAGGVVFAGRFGPAGLGAVGARGSELRVSSHGQDIA